MTVPRSLPRKSTHEMQTLIQVALGAAPADLVVLDADLVNVYTGEIQKRMGAAVKGPWIARVAEDVRDAIGPATRVVEARGRTLAPGLIDGHTHLAWIYTAAEFVPFAAAAGTTTVVTETMESYPVGGVAAVVDFLESCRGQPIRILATAPAMASISTSARGIAAGDLETLLSREEILGLHKKLGPAQDVGLRVEGTFELQRLSLIDALNAH